MINKDFHGIYDLGNWARAQGAEEMKKKKNIIFECADGHHYIYTTDTVAYVDGVKVALSGGALIEVDMLGPRYSREDSTTVDVELKIVPARFIEGTCDINAIIVRDLGNGNSAYTLSEYGFYDVRMIEAPGNSTTETADDDADELDIEAVINGEDIKNDSKTDLLYIAIANLDKFDLCATSIKLEGKDVQGEYRYPRARLRPRLAYPLGGVPVTEDTGGGLNIARYLDNSGANLCNNSLEGTVAISPRERYCLKFISDTIPDTTSIFLIRNKRFVCEKLEVEVNASGVSKLITGYFFELQL